MLFEGYERAVRTFIPRRDLVFTLGGPHEVDLRRGGRFVGVPGDIANQTVLEFVFEKNLVGGII